MKARRVVGFTLLAGIILLASSVPGGTPLNALGSAAPPPTTSVRVLPLAANAGWTEVGTGSASGGGISQNYLSAYPALAVAPGNAPYIAWHYWDLEANSGYVYVRRWNGSSWQEVGAGSASGGGISDNDGDSLESALAVAPNGTPYVAWSDSSGGDWEIYVRRWNGSNWEEVGAGSASGGGISNNSGNSDAPAIAVGPNGTPYVVWSDSSGADSEIYVRRWNGSSWEEVGAGSASGGGISRNGSVSGAPALAVAADSTPYVAWNDDGDEDMEIYVRRWNGSRWEEVGMDSASGGGISDNSGVSLAPALAVALDGTPYVAWNDDSDGGMEIYVRRWSWRIWEEVGVGSASGGGVSDTDGWSSGPVLAAAPDGTLYVAWHENRYDSSDIYVRRWAGIPNMYLPLVVRGN